MFGSKHPSRKCPEEIAYAQQLLADRQAKSPVYASEAFTPDLAPPLPGEDWLAYLAFQNLISTEAAQHELELNIVDD
jgi:hypothetical protein